MTFKVTVKYQVHDGSVMEKEIARVIKIEHDWERIGEVLRVYTKDYCWFTWEAGSILNITMDSEKESAESEGLLHE